MFLMIKDIFLQVYASPPRMGSLLSLALLPEAPSAAWGSKLLHPTAAFTAGKQHRPARLPSGNEGHHSVPSANMVTPGHPGGASSSLNLYHEPVSWG